MPAGAEPDDSIPPDPPEAEDELDSRDYLASRSLWYLAAVLAVVLAVPAAGLVLISLPRETRAPLPGPVATPPPLPLGRSAEPVTAVLPALASRVERLQPPSPGQYDHVTYQEWSVWMGAERAAATTASPRRQDVWLAADGSGRRVSESTGPPLPMPRYDRAVRAAPGGVSPAPSADEVVGAGTLSRHFGSGPLPRGPGEMEALLTSRSGMDTWEAVPALYRERVVDPAGRASILRMLATLGGVTYRGPVTDHLGRPGFALSRTGTWSTSPAQHTMIFDEQTGHLLATETLLTAYSGKLPLQVPAVVGYETFIAAERTDSLD